MSKVTASAISHDRLFKGTLEPRGKITLVFRALAYEQYNEVVLAKRLTELADRLTAGCREGQQRAAESRGLHVETAPHWDADVRRYREERDRLPISWTSPNGDITLACQGLRNWQVSVKPGATKRLTEADFVAQMKLTAAGVWCQYQRELARLRQRRRAELTAATAKAS